MLVYKRKRAGHSSRGGKALLLTPGQRIGRKNGGVKHGGVSLIKHLSVLGGPTRQKGSHTSGRVNPGAAERSCHRSVNGKITSRRDL